MSRLPGKRIVALFLVLGALLCAGIPAWGAAPLVMVDQGHGQRFVIEQEGELQLSRFGAILGEEGLRVAASRERLTDESLRQATGLVISGPFAPLAPAEVDAVIRFIERGGRVALMLHIGPPVGALMQRVGIAFSNGVLHEQHNLVGTDDISFQVRDLTAHPLFAGIDHFSLYGGWALNGQAPLARTSAETWVDLNGDQQLAERDAMDRFTVVAEGNVGAGRILVFGDDGIFQNRYLDEANSRLARNLAQWLGGGKLPGGKVRGRDM